MSNVDALGTRAAHFAMVGAADRINALGLKGSIDVDAVIAALKRIAPAASLAAMDDAREAFAAGMTHAGEATFRASMVLAGIKAVNEVVAS